MFQKFISATAIIVATNLLLTNPSFAQTSDASELSAEELEELFSNQRTRGLLLAPTTSADDAPQSADSDVANVPSEETYVELAPEDQVNIQISFDFDSSALRDDQKPKLATLCQVMHNVDVDVFRIVGHTDASGTVEYNERLSLLRAQEVKRFMVSDCGITSERLEAVGVGEAFPFDQTDPNDDVNRRVEFQALS
jgi:outer membrane protein OmpA-like peptidoglycan-associated protein